MASFVNFIYNYCTEFVFNLANLLALSYYEINALIFVVAWPLITLFLLIIFIFQIIKLIKRKNRAIT